MKAWEVTAPGVVSLGDRDRQELAEHEVRIAAHTVSLNYRDLLVSRGQYDPRMPYPRVLCSDVCGTVVQAGRGTSVGVGTRVVSSFHTTWLDGPLTDSKRRGDLGGSIDGVLQEEVVLPASAVVAAPAHLSDAQACTLPCAGVTAYRALFVDAGLTAGQAVLTLGTGGVSLFALQLAKAAGAEVAITSSSDDKLARAAEWGADVGVNYRTTPRWGRAVRAWRPADVVVELGGSTLDESLAAVATGGHIAVIGILDGVQSTIALTRIVMRAIRVQGVVVGSVADLNGLCEFMTAHPEVQPIIDHIVPFADAGQAIAELANGLHIGKVVVQIAGT